MKIPCIIHQTWKSHDIPEMFAQMAQTWKSRHPHWEYRLWTDDMNRDFIATHFPHFLSVYDNYPTNIQRVDAVRYFALYKYGGFFIDLDFECLARLDPLLSQNNTCIFGKEPEEHCLIHEKDLIISNAFMGAIPDSEFFRYICEELLHPTDTTTHPNNRVLESTGPFMLSRIYQQYPRKDEINLLAPELLYPLTKDELEAPDYSSQDTTILTRLQHAYGIHHYAGTWWKKS
ncbi:glycosyltransferase family 32 protein [Chitinophaga varians]|uniref:glycosyltransferase family 32 protein n=1 Tax=Chitinophaga varians TaxID=2202339 RepID=UPI00165F8327|nr:glycosyltransferase [Chitinophaga varians]MBC9913415.1 glycoside transferase family 32 [Chitinophaga varians]